MKTLWIATLETNHFSFDAFGATAEDARATLGKGLAAHAEQMQLPEDWYVDYLDDIAVREVRLGHAYRDRTLITEQKGTST